MSLLSCLLLTPTHVIIDDYAWRLSNASRAALVSLSSALDQVTRVNATTSASAHEAGVRGDTTTTNAAAEWSVCLLVNETVCPTTAAGESVVVLLYNPLGHTRTVYGRVPWPIDSATVLTGATPAAPVTAQILPTMSSAIPSTPAPYTVVWEAVVPPMGYATFFVVPPSAQHRGHSAVVSHAVSARTNADVVMENDCVRAVVSADTGKLASLTDKESGVSIAVR